MRFAGLVVLVVGLGACGDYEPKNCSRNGQADCKDDELCLYSGNKSNSYFCFIPCEATSDCPLGLHCEYAASSCDVCMDIYKVCVW